MIDKQKIIDYIIKEFDVLKLTRIKENKKTINVKFISTSYNDWSVTLNKTNFEKKVQNEHR